MKPVCSARKVNGVHVVSLPQSGTSFYFQENSFEGSPKVKVTAYPGKSMNDPEYIDFSKKREVEIKNMMLTVKPNRKKSFFNPKEKQMIHAVSTLSPKAKRIHNNKSILNDY